MNIILRTLLHTKKINVNLQTFIQFLRKLVDFLDKEIFFVIANVFPERVNYSLRIEAFKNMLLFRYLLSIMSQLTL